MMVCDGKKLLTTLVRDLIALMALAILMASICCCIALSHRKRMAVVVAIHYTPDARIAANYPLKLRAPLTKNSLTLSFISTVLISVGSLSLAFTAVLNNRILALIWVTVGYCLFIILLIGLACQTVETHSLELSAKEVFAYSWAFFCRGNDRLKRFVEFYQNDLKCENLPDCLKATERIVKINPTIALSYVTLWCLLVSMIFCLWLANLLAMNQTVCMLQLAEDPDIMAAVNETNYEHLPMRKYYDADEE